MKKKMIIIGLAMLVLLTTSAFARPICPVGSALDEHSLRPFANSVVSTSGTVIDAINAVGKFDHNYAIINATHPFSGVVYDMGAGEEIWDANGNDFSILFGDWGTPYNAVKVYVSDSPNSGFELVDAIAAVGSRNLDFSSTSYDKIRYIKIVNINNPHVNTMVGHISGYCMDEDDQQNSVPEFTVAGSLLIVLGLGLLVLIKRKQD